MLLRSGLLMFCLLFLAGCQHSSVQIASPSMQSAQQYRQVPAFTRVNVSGLLNVRLHTGYATPQVILHGDPRDLVYVQTKVVSGNLYVALGSGYPRYGSVTADIRGNTLNAFTYHGAGIIKGTKLRTRFLEVDIENPGTTTLQGNIDLRKLVVKGTGTTVISGIHSPYLQITLSGKSTVRLSGMANISSLNMGGASRLSLYWVNSKELVINGKDDAFIQLAGVTQRLQVNLWGQAHFNGRYLRAEEAFVKTHNTAIAEIATVLVQHSLARDRSDIRFYNLPTMKTDFMLKSGAVLDMRDLSLPFIQEYGSLNKP